MEEVAGTPRLVDPAAVDAENALTATLPRSDIEAALRDEAGADLFLEIARIQNGERDDRTVKIAWERSDLEDLLRRATGDPVTLTFDPAELERWLDPDVEAQGMREKLLVLTVAAATAAGMAGGASAQVLSDGGGGGASSAAVSGLVTDNSTGGVPGSVTSIATDASTSGSTAADPGPSVPGYNVVTDASTSGQPGAVSGFTTDASTGNEPGSVSGFITDTGAERTRTPAAPAVGGGGSGFTVPDSAIEGALAGGLALLITGAAFVTRTQRRRETTA